MLARVVLCLSLAGVSAAQRETVYTIDLNGGRVPGLEVSRVETPAGERRTTSVTSINGREAPLETVEERLVSSGPDARIVERTVVRYSPDGCPEPAERIRIEEIRRPDGGTTRRSTTWRRDINGNLQPAGRRVSESRPSGETRSVIERPGAGGVLEVVERATRMERGNTAETVTFGRDANGSFHPVRREVTSTSVDGNATVEDSTLYTPAHGGFEPAGRRVVRTVTRPGGLKLREIEVYSRLGAEVASEPRLQRRVREEESAGLGGTVLRITSVRDPQDEDFRVVRETRIEPH